MKLVSKRPEVVLLVFWVIGSTVAVHAPGAHDNAEPLFVRILSVSVKFETSDADKAS